MALEDKYVGIFNEDGSVSKWPAVTLAGKDYVRPVTTIRTSPRRFVAVHSSDEMDLLKQREDEGLELARKAEAVAEPGRPVATPAPSKKAD